MGMVVDSYRFAAAAPSFDPSDLGAALLGWYDPSDASTITASSGNITQIDDKSGNGRHLTNATASPKTGTATLNGLNVMEFTPSNARMVNSAMPTINVAVIRFIVLSVNASDSQYMLASAFEGGPWAYMAISGSSGTPISSNATSISLYVNGGVATPTTRGDVYSAIGNSPVLARVHSTFSVHDGFSIGYPSFEFGSNTKIGEVLVTTALTSDDITAVEDYLADKWGI